MIDVCETEDALVSYVSDWARLVVETPGRRTRKRANYPLPASEEALNAYALDEAKRATSAPWGDRQALAKWAAPSDDLSTGQTPE
ncbi:protein of unknown function (plasmid) [Agreia sp. COWG]|nr:protein of unknown function [Agreia sp. COWG]